MSKRLTLALTLPLVLVACGKAAPKEDRGPSETISSAKPSPNSLPPPTIATAQATAATPSPTATAAPQQVGGLRRPKARVRAASTSSMTGRLSPEQVESAVSDNIDRFASCADSDVTVSLRALVAETGKVVNASAGRSTPDEARVRDCVVSAFKAIQFPASPDGKSAPIEFDLVLSPAS